MSQDLLVGILIGFFLGFIYHVWSFGKHAAKWHSFPHSPPSKTGSDNQYINLELNNE